MASVHNSLGSGTYSKPAPACTPPQFTATPRRLLGEGHWVPAVEPADGATGAGPEANGAGAGSRLAMHSGGARAGSTAGGRAAGERGVGKWESDRYLQRARLSWSVRRGAGRQCGSRHCAWMCAALGEAVGSRVCIKGAASGLAPYVAADVPT